MLLEKKLLKLICGHTKEKPRWVSPGEEASLVRVHYSWLRTLASISFGEASDKLSSG